MSPSYGAGRPTIIEQIVMIVGIAVVGGLILQAARGALYKRMNIPVCPACQRPMGTQTGWKE